jgi:hypothetical protein
MKPLTRFVNKHTASLAAIFAMAVACARLPAAAHPDISGYWELRYDSMGVPTAALVGPLSPAAAEAQRRHDVESIRYCIPVGVPYLLGDRAPLDIRQSPTVTAMVAKVQSSARYIFTDGRKHPEKDDLDPTTNGHSIGSWDGDTFVVDTVGFNDRGITRLPGGGVRTPTSHLVERYRLLEGGSRLSVTFTWEDPKVFQKPHTYEFRYYRIPKIEEPRMFACDMGDQERVKFLMSAVANP